MSPKKVREFFSRLAAADPEPKGELEFATPYQLLVAVVLSAQATDKGVNRATRPLFREHPTPQAIAALGEEGLSDYLQTIGLYRTKAKNVAALSRLLLERHGGEVPHDRAALEALPGVGRKTANVVLKAVPNEFRLHAHHWLILHGRYVCKARKPDCPNCLVADLCAYKEKTRV